MNNSKEDTDPYKILALSVIAQAFADYKRSKIIYDKIKSKKPEALTFQEEYILNKIRYIKTTAIKVSKKTGIPVEDVLAISRVGNKYPDLIESVYTKLRTRQIALNRWNSEIKKHKNRYKSAEKFLSDESGTLQFWCDASCLDKNKVMDRFKEVSA